MSDGAPDGRNGAARAVIDIGSSAIRMVVGEVERTGAIRILDRADRPVPLGHDVFGSGTASRTTIGASLDALASFQELLRGWGIGPGETTVIATSALREAENRDTFVDRVALRTGLDVRVIDGVEENRLTYLGAVHAIKAAIPGFARSNSLIMQIGTGSTEFMLLRRGRMAFVHSLKLGSARMEDMLRPMHGNPERLRRVLSETVAPTREVLSHEQPLKHIRRFVAGGGVIRLAASRAGRRVAEHCSLIERPALQELIRGLQALRVEELVHELSIPYEDAEGILPDLIVYDLFLESTAAQQVIVPELSIREGVLLSAALADEESRREFERQTIASALSVARKYHAEDPHVRHVTRLALVLFDLLAADHGLGHRERLLLNVAALLHEVGKLIKASGHPQARRLHRRQLRGIRHRRAGHGGGRQRRALPPPGAACDVPPHVRGALPPAAAGGQQAGGDPAGRRRAGRQPPGPHRPLRRRARRGRAAPEVRVSGRPVPGADGAGAQGGADGSGLRAARRAVLTAGR